MNLAAKTLVLLCYAAAAGLVSVPSALATPPDAPHTSVDTPTDTPADTPIAAQGGAKAVDSSPAVNPAFKDQTGVGFSENARGEPFYRDVSKDEEAEGWESWDPLEGLLENLRIQKEKLKELEGQQEGGTQAEEAWDLLKDKTLAEKIEMLKGWIKETEREIEEARNFEAHIEEERAREEQEREEEERLRRLEEERAKGNLSPEQERELDMDQASRAARERSYEEGAGAAGEGRNYLEPGEGSPRRPDSGE